MHNAADRHKILLRDISFVGFAFFRCRSVSSDVFSVCLGLALSSVSSIEGAVHWHALCFRSFWP
jgi:hypothetical protein